MLQTVSESQGNLDCPGESGSPRLSSSVGHPPDCASTVVTRPRLSQDSRGKSRLSRTVGGACRHGALPTLPGQSGTFPTVPGQSERSMKRYASIIGT